MSNAVSTAVSSITYDLQSGWRNPVTLSDVKDVVKTLLELSPKDAAVAVEQLEQKGLLKAFANEATERAAVWGHGGLSHDERKSMFVDMAKKFDGTTLAKISNAFSESSSWFGDPHNDVLTMADSIANHSSAQVKIEFISEISGRLKNKNHVIHILIGITNGYTYNKEAAATAKILSSMIGTNAEQAFRKLKPDQLRTVLEASLGETHTTSPYGSQGANTSVSWSPEPFRDLMNAARTIANADMKARIFDAGVDTLRVVRDLNDSIGHTTSGKDKTISNMIDGLTVLVNSDVNGVIGELNRNTETRDGSDFASYSKEMLASGRENLLADQMNKLQFGNNKQENAVERLYKSTTTAGTADVRLYNAETLGYFIGSVNAGVNAVSKDINNQRETTSVFLNAALTLIDKLGEAPLGLGVATGASLGKDFLQVSVNAAIQDPTADTGARLAKAALPSDPKTGESAVGTKVDEAFYAALTRVQIQSKP